MFKISINKIFIIFFIFLVFSLNIFANSFTKISNNTYATVTDIIDGDSIKVKLNSGEIAYVKLAGITSNGYDEAYVYLKQKLLGATVYLVNQETSSSEKWNYMLVYYNGVNLNEDLLERGYAIIDKTQSNTSINSSLVTAQSNAYAYGNGIFSYTSTTSSTITGQTSSSIYSGNKININTATKSQLKTYLNNITDTLASSIISYREKNPFSTIAELKFVDGITRDIYNQNKNIITVSTNINTAYDLELKTLGNLSDSEINKIIEYRAENQFKKIETLKEIITSSKYSKISPYISVTDEDEIYATFNSYVANINGAEKNYLAYTGLSSSNASIIINYRQNGYTYKTLGELLYLPNITLTEKTLHYLEDNLQVMTNLNTQNKNDLYSLFSSTLSSKIFSTNISKNSTEDYLKSFLTSNVYYKVKDFIYIDENPYEYININTSTKDELKSIGLSNTQITSIINSRPIKDSSLLPFNISSFNTKISLYTNINNSSEKELKSLSSSMTSSIISNIKKYVNEQPFSSLEEFKQFLTSIGEENLYDTIKDFIVFR